MSTKNFVTVAALAAVTGLIVSVASASITIATATIGNPGNTADPTTGTVYGSVPYIYNIGTTEVTNAQYAAFLNAVAATDTNNLYNTNMAGTFGGITRSGSDGTYTYATIAGRETHPVNYVTFWDATRFANWLHNGQPTGAQNNSTTENGTYTLTADGISANAIVRNANGSWAVTTVDEWYKAAFHQPVAQGGDLDSYWRYPTSSNMISTAEANFGNLIGNTTPVGSYPANFYGAFDMGGNLFEWTEEILFTSTRGFIGGSFVDSSISLQAGGSGGMAPNLELDLVGFRVVQVPGPSSVALLAIGGLGALGGRRRRGVGR